MSSAPPGDAAEPPGVRPGRSWGSETSSPPDIEVSGGDRVLAAVLEGGLTDPLVRFVAGPGSDLARAVGLVAGAVPAGMALPLDAFTLAPSPAGGRFRGPGPRPEGNAPPGDSAGPGGPVVWAVNSVVVGVAPDRLRAWHRAVPLDVEIDGTPVEVGAATTVVVMNGQYLRGHDVSPRGHPGDGVAEAQVYALGAGARRAMRRRLLTGAHLPHPSITRRRARRVLVRTPRPVAMEVDGEPAGRVTAVEITLRPEAYRLLV